jgi:hypothetical protein
VVVDRAPPRDEKRHEQTNGKLIVRRTPPTATHGADEGGTQENLARC